MGNIVHENDDDNLIKFMYLSPELLERSVRVRQAVREANGRNKVCRVVFDEAHVLFKCCRDFRPFYRHVGRVMREELCPGVPIVVLSATLSDAELISLQDILRLQEAKM